MTPVGWERRGRGDRWPVLCLLVGGDGRAGVLDAPDVEPDPHVPGLEDPSRPFPGDVLSPTEALMGEEGRAVARRLAHAGVPVTAHFYPGTHAPAYWVREAHRTLPWLLRQLRPRHGGA